MKKVRIILLLLVLSISCFDCNKLPPEVNRRFALVIQTVAEKGFRYAAGLVAKFKVKPTRIYFGGGIRTMDNSVYRQTRLEIGNWTRENSKLILLGILTDLGYQLQGRSSDASLNISNELKYVLKKKYPTCTFNSSDGSLRIKLVPTSIISLPNGNKIRLPKNVEEGLITIGIRDVLEGITKDKEPFKFDVIIGKPEDFDPIPEATIVAPKDSPTTQQVVKAPPVQNKEDVEMAKHFNDLLESIPNDRIEVKSYKNYKQYNYIQYSYQSTGDSIKAPFAIARVDKNGKPFMVMKSIYSKDFDYQNKKLVTKFGLN